MGGQPQRSVAHARIELRGACSGGFAGGMAEKTALEAAVWALVLQMAVFWGKALVLRLESQR